MHHMRVTVLFLIKVVYCIFFGNPLIICTCSDVEKRRSTLQKLASLHAAVGSMEEALSSYQVLVSSYSEDAGEDRVRVWREVLVLLYGLHCSSHSDLARDMVGGAELILSAYGECKYFTHS